MVHGRISPIGQCLDYDRNEYIFLCRIDNFVLTVTHEKCGENLRLKSWNINRKPM